MWRRILACGGTVTVAGLAWAQPAQADGIRTPQTPSYSVTLKSNASGSIWTGRANITFTNASASPLDDINLRLWGNARGKCPSTPVTLSRFTGGKPGPLTLGCTSLRFDLAKRLTRDQTTTIGFDLKIVVPAGADRFGRDGSYNFLGNALPVLAVHDGAGWHRDRYTDVGDPFYTVTGDFKVKLDHPASLQVPATGTSVDTPGSPGRTVTTVTAAKVRDFAWAAGPFMRSRSVSTTGVRVNVWRTSGITLKRASSMMAVAKKAMATDAQFGDYPYAEVDVVLDDKLRRARAEYPGIVFNHVDTTAVVSTIAHQWWYGILGSDQFTSPWLDEAFATYATDLYFQRTGAGCWAKVKWASTSEKITNSMAYWNAHPTRYTKVVSGYGSCALHDLRRKLGSTKMRDLLRSYLAADLYGVTTTGEFKARTQSVSTAYLSAFWKTHRIPG